MFLSGVLKLAGGGRITDQSDEDLIQAGKQFLKRMNRDGLVKQITQYVVGAFPFPYLYDLLLFAGADQIEWRVT
jgi:hypothetical protein